MSPTLPARGHKLLACLILAGLVIAAFAPAGASATQAGPAQLMPPNPRLDDLIQRGEVQVPQMVEQVDASALRTEAMASAAALTGPVNALAVLVDFSDKVKTVQASFFDSLIFAAPTPGRGSVKDYFNDISYGQVDIVTLHLPSQFGWNRAPRPYTYYVNGQYCTGGKTYPYSYPNNCQKLAEDIVDAINGVVDFSKYDNNHDGQMEPLMIVHAGPGAEFSGQTSDIWSHSWSMAIARTYDGVTISRYVIMPEYWLSASASTSDMTIGVFAHEMGHGFWNLPDLYDTDGTSQGIGNWSLMAGGSWNGPANLCEARGCYYSGSSPAWPDAWSRLKMGYTTATPVSANLAGQSIPEIGSGSSGTILQLKNAGLASQEYFLVENRQKTSNTYDEYLPGAGLAIWHIDEAKSTYGNTQECKTPPNYACGSTHYEVALEQADGLLELENNINRGTAGDVFSAATKNAWNGTTNPESGSWYSSTPTNIAVSNISASGLTMTADLQVAGAAPTPPAAPSNLTATAASSSQINLAWADNAGNEQGFKIERCTGAGCSTFTQIATVAANVTAYSNIGLTASTSYTYRVRAYNASGDSAYSNTAGATTPAAPALPAAPTDLAAKAISRSQINLTWTDSAGNETGFRIERCKGSTCTNFMQIATVAANAISFANTGLTKNTAYRYRVAAYNVAGTSTYSNIATATTTR